MKIHSKTSPIISFPLLMSFALPTIPLLSFLTPGFINCVKEISGFLLKQMSSISICTALGRVINTILVSSHCTSLTETRNDVSLPEWCWPQPSPYPTLLHHISRVLEADWKLLIIYEGTYYLMAKDWYYFPCTWGRKGYADIGRKVSKGRETPGKALGVNTQSLVLISTQIPTSVTFTGLCQRHSSLTECVVPRWCQMSGQPANFLWKWFQYCWSST